MDEVIIQFVTEEDLSFFPFNTRDRGYNAPSADGFQLQTNGKYCVATLIEGGKQFDCWYVYPPSKNLRTFLRI